MKEVTAINCRNRLKNITVIQTHYIDLF